ncbi:zinc finger domain-containing protein [Streptomyces cinereoruber]|uniref:zinc finger domain-containing protein n=1 Tax=Streptomyces cinereoruber TaxID=67260 RepID=UPI003643EDA6
MKVTAPALSLPQLSVACPSCGAAAGRLCTSHGGTRIRRSNVHQPRTAAWTALQKEKIQARVAHVDPAAARTALAKLPPDTIEHGTTRGYSQHRTRGVPSCQPCRDAINAQTRKREAAREGASEAQKRWNRGHVGTPTAPAPVPTGRDCTVAGCGELASTPRPAARMVRVAVPGSREPARWYCPGPCRMYGEALAEVRAIGDRRG